MLPAVPSFLCWLAELLISMALSVSLLSADVLNLGRALREIVSSGCRRIHIDIMDGHFVDNIALGFSVAEAVSRESKLYIECHMMVSEPAKWVSAAAAGGCSLFIFHSEAVEEPCGLIAAIKETGMEAGVAISPATSVSAISGILPLLDYVLVLAVTPGFGGQPMDTELLKKIGEIRQIRGDVSVGIDGGYSSHTAELVERHCPDVVTVGSAFWGGGIAASAGRLF